jgi:uncharacterized protein involved in exopolysaccharide biosynthesis
MTPPLESPARADREADELSLLDVVTPLARRWRVIVFAPIVVALLTLAAAAVWPPRYTAKLSFTPEQAKGGGLLNEALSGLGALGGLAGSMGLSKALDDGPSSEFFAGVLQSRELLEETLSSPFRDPDEPRRTRTLQEIMDPWGSTPARRRGNALRKLAKRATVAVDRKTGIVTLSVALHDAQLSADVANRMGELLNRFNLERRQSSSREQRRFSEERLRVARAELRDAELAVARFMSANRRYQGSPVLLAEAQRLERDVRTREEVVQSLSSAYEEARIAEVRDTPVLTIIDRAAPPDRPSSPRPLLWTATLGFVAAAVAVAWALLAGFRDRERLARRRDVRELKDALGDARSEVRALVGRP